MGREASKGKITYYPLKKYKIGDIKMNDINDKELAESLFKILIHQNISKVNHLDQCNNLFDFAEFGDVTETDRWNTLKGWAKLTAARLYNRALALSLVACEIATHEPNTDFYYTQMERINSMIQQIKDLEYNIFNFAKEAEDEKRARDN